MLRRPRIEAMLTMVPPRPSAARCRATSAPLAASSVAKCAPRPLDAPVTSATSPVRSTLMLMATPRSQRARLVAQHEFLDLACRGLGQRAEDDGLRQLEMGKVGAAPCHYLVLAQRCS